MTDESTGPDIHMPPHPIDAETQNRSRPPRGRLRFVLELAVVAVLIVLFATLSLGSLRHKSLTFDEPIDIANGHHFVTHGGDTAPGDLHHPPLAQAVYGLPIEPMGLRPMTDYVATHGILLGMEPGDPIDTKPANYHLAHFFLYENEAPGPVIVRRARTVAVAFGAALVVTAWLVARGVFGPVAGVTAAALIALSPNVIAHARLTLSDVPLALFTIAFLGLLYATLERLTLLRAVCVGLALGLALATKVSAVLLYGVAPLLPILALLWRRPMRPGGWAFGRLPRWAAVMASGAVVLVVSFAVPGAFYGFDYSVGQRRAIAAREAERVYPDTEEADFDETNDPDPLRRRLLETGFRWMPLPAEYAHLVSGVAVASREGRPSLAFGHRIQGGRWYYFPGTILLKTPPPVLLLVVASIAGAVAMPFASRKANASDKSPSHRLTVSPSHPHRLAVFLLFVAVYMAMAMRSNLNLGHRHLLPVFGPVAVCVGGMVGWWIRRWPKAVGVVVAGCALWLGAITVSIYPDYLSYFNVFAGGPEGGYRYYVDSNLDWGQDLPALARYQKEHNLGPVRLHYWGTASPEAWGIETAPKEPGERYEPKKGVYVVSATLLQGVGNAAPGVEPPFGFLKTRQPEAVLGGSLFVYKVE